MSTFLFIRDNLLRFLLLAVVALIIIRTGTIKKERASIKAAGGKQARLPINSIR